MNKKVEWKNLLPEEFTRRKEKLPVIFLPLGTVEWHGYHNALGLDALKAEELCKRAAVSSGGGIVHPPVYGGMGGLSKPATVVMEDEMSWENYLLRPWLEKLCYEFHRLDFKGVIILTGHYGHNQQITVRETAVRMTERLQIPVLGTAEYWLAQDAGYLGDHAGTGETSLMMYLCPDLVSLDKFEEDPDFDLTAEVKNKSSRELGRKYARLIIERMAEIANSMIDWDESKLEAYVKAERSLLSSQVKGWREKSPWAAWDKMADGRLTNYGSLLVEEDFKEIEKIGQKLL